MFASSTHRYPGQKDLLSVRRLCHRDQDHLLTKNGYGNHQDCPDNNTFGFGNRNYIQKEGVAIGSRLGKNFACTYMRKWDEELLKARVTPLFHKQFIDDGFGVWTGSEEELKECAAFVDL